MPVAPPRIGGPRKKREPWAISPHRPDQRKRGRAGQKERAEILAAEPLCRPCRKAGRTRAATIVDHILPLAWGGSDDRANKQPCCKPCHDEKSAAERAIDARQRRRFD